MKRGNHSKSRFSKGLVMLLALVLVFGVAVGGTIAWLADKTQTVTNTFTASGITISIAETKGTDGTGEGINKNFQMIPGKTIDKDPKVTVDGAKTNVDCYLYVMVEESANFKTFFETYEMADGWEGVEGQTNVYCRQVLTGDAVKSFDVIKGNQVTVKSAITDEQMEELTEATYPTLKVTAYAIQTHGFADEVAAWAEAKNLS